MEEWEQMDKPMRELLEVIHFTEKVSAKIYGVLNEAEIYRIVKEEFAKSKRYSVGIFLLTDDGSKLRIAGTSIASEKLKAGEKISGLRLKEYRINLNKSSIYNQVIKEGKTVQVKISDLISELLPQPLARLITKISGYKEKYTILTPLKMHRKIIGVLAVSSTNLAEHFIPSVRSLAKHISTALELADECAARKQAEEMLRAARDELEIRVQERTAELAKANEALQTEITEHKRTEESLNRMAVDLKGRAEELFALQKIATSIQSSLELNEILQQAADGIVKGLEYNSVYIMLLDEDEEFFKGAAFSTKSGITEKVEKIIGFSLTKLRFPAKRDYNEAVGNTLDGRITIKHHLHEMAIPPLNKVACFTLQRLLNTKTIITLPLFVTGGDESTDYKKVIGSLLATTQREELTESEIQSLLGFANEIGIAVEKARLFDEVAQRLKELSSLQEVSAAVAGELELESVLHLIVEKVIDLTKAETASVSLVSADSKKRTHVASYGVDADMLQGKSLSVDEGRHGWVIRTGEPLLSHNFHEDERTSSLGLKIGARSEIIAPLKVKGKAIGCLSAINKRENQRFTEEDLRLLTLFANQAGIAIENAQLYQQQKDINEELQQSYALLEEKNKELESFVYTVSHDLRTPLISLEGFASILLSNNYREALDEEGQLYLSRIQANVERMGNLIQDLLELSRIGRIVNDYESVDITGIIKEAIETLEIQLSERGTELVIQEGLPTIRCDRVRMKQVFDNLVCNANKFIGDENDKPRIEIGFHEKEDSFEFFVKDNGIGIQKEYHEKVFEVFTRLGDVEVEGTGVGLAIVKKIVETHGGKIWIDSEVSKGTTVYFTLPKSSQSNPQNRGRYPNERGSNQNIVGGRQF